jgi:hypothetical protein
MADNDLAGLKWCSYFTAVARLEDECGWKKQRAHAEFIDAVNGDT